MKYLLNSIGAAFLVSQIFSPQAFAEDVYNFYFQKAPGPTTVIQGGSGEKTQPVKALTPEEAALQTKPAMTDQVQTTATTAAIVSPQQDLPRDYKRFEILLGVSELADKQSVWKGQGIGFNFNFSKYIGIQVTILRASESESPYLSLEGTRENRDELDVSLGALITPLHLDLFGYNFLDLSLLGGVLSTRDTSPGTYTYLGRVAQPLPQNRQGKLFVGSQATLNLGQTLGVFAQVKWLPDQTKYGQAMAGMTVRF